MRVRGLDGKEYRWRLDGYAVPEGGGRQCSSGHKEARSLLKELFPFDNPLEEVPLPGCPWTLYLDFVLPKRKLAVEVQGEQHRTFSRHFHGTPAKFLAHKQRDAAKASWCLTNGITLVCLHDDRRNEWRATLRNPFGPGQNEGV